MDCRGFRFASDDQAARREAGRLGVRLTGTIGILAKAVRMRICDIKTADRYLGKMINHDGLKSSFLEPKTSI